MTQHEQTVEVSASQEMPESKSTKSKLISAPESDFFIRMSSVTCPAAKSEDFGKQ